MSIRIEVIPTKCVGKNLHSHGIIRSELWSDVSMQIRARHKSCYCCHQDFDISRLKAHEIWIFDEESHTQILQMIVSVCDKCHSTTHFNFILSNQNMAERDYVIAKAHYLEVNNCDVKTFEKDLSIALNRYRKLNQIEGEWTLDISYALREGFLVWEDINMEALEKVAPGSAKYLEEYKPKRKLMFNEIPVKSLVDRAESSWKRNIPKACAICGMEQLVLYQFYDLRLKPKSSEMRLAGKKEICTNCKKTIYSGSSKLFLKHRKTTRHYMEVNACSYEECKAHAQSAKRLRKIRKNNMVVYFKKETTRLEQPVFALKNEYLKSHGAKFDGKRMQWYLCPVKNLKAFKDFL